MAVTTKVLGQAAPAATTETDLYTVPAATSAVGSSVVVCNRSAVAITFRLSVSVGGGATANKDYLYFDVQVEANATFIATIGPTVNAADKVRVFASTANVSFTLFGQELTALIGIDAKVLGQAAPAATTETDLYTVPGATSTVGSSIVVCNRGTIATSFRVSVSVGGGATANKDYIYFDVQIEANSTFIATIAPTLAAADKVRVFAGNANLSFSLFGQELF